MIEERYKKLKASAQRYTAYRERAPKEVSDKLREWNASEDIVDRILEELTADKFIDEERFARAFCHDKFLMNRWGKIRLSMEMARYGLSDFAKRTGLQSISDEEYHRTVQELTSRKWDQTKETDLFKKKQKVVRYLMQKGFESDLVWLEINKLDNR